MSPQQQSPRRRAHVAARRLGYLGGLLSLLGAASACMADPSGDADGRPARERVARAAAVEDSSVAVRRCDGRIRRQLGGDAAVVASSRTFRRQQPRTFVLGGTVRTANGVQRYVCRVELSSEFLGEKVSAVITPVS